MMMVVLVVKCFWFVVDYGHKGKAAAPLPYLANRLLPVSYPILSSSLLSYPVHVQSSFSLFLSFFLFLSLFISIVCFLFLFALVLLFFSPISFRIHSVAPDWHYSIDFYHRWQFWLDFIPIAITIQCPLHSHIISIPIRFNLQSLFSLHLNSFRGSRLILFNWFDFHRWFDWISIQLPFDFHSIPFQFN